MINKTTATPLRIAYFSPLPPARSGISDYSRELLPHLARHAQITLFADDPAQVDPALHAQFPIYSLTDYPSQRWQYDLPLYHLGNSVQYHETTYQLFTRFPGVVVLHDFIWHKFLRHRAVLLGKLPDYTRELGFALGQEGINRAWQFRKGEYTPSTNEYPLIDRLLTLCLGLIVHSQFAARQIPPINRPVRVIPALIESHAGHNLRAQLNWPDDAVIFASIGHVTANKQVDFALQAFQKVQLQFPQARYLIVGQEEPNIHLQEQIDALNLADVARAIGYIPSLQAFVDWIHSADVIVNLRHPTIGETSAAALRAMAAGRPVIVFDQGWYSELPDAGCMKVAPMDADALALTMQQLASDAALRQRIGEAARTYTQDVCAPAQVAAQYGRFLHEIYASYQPGP
ncbi:MAG: glycosyltransferase [Ardenticatenaceae bacterium]|nr:glycosyltransferase [Anaerolineales bacterium]MCB8920753.1 glycosyltransferase [Ardenticatenaceae bacterium]MCB8989712.1 glycosyltransferase [Ardenticatenaceae bacterium]MCB9002829.1 glycosyltransferase [Ardenticatenaceae bacterium]